jgi:hypothetical protein
VGVDGANKVKIEREREQELLDEAEHHVVVTLENGDFVEQCVMSDKLHELVARLEAETHPEEMKITRRDAGRTLPKTALSSREWQTLDWFFAGVLARHGAFGIFDATKRLAAYQALGAEVLAQMQSVIDSRTDQCEMTIEDLAEAAAEQDLKRAFVLYVEAVFDYRELDVNKDFNKRVLPAVIEQPFDQQKWAKDYAGIDVPDGYDYGRALVMLRNAAEAH